MPVVPPLMTSVPNGRALLTRGSLRILPFLQGVAFPFGGERGEPALQLGAQEPAASAPALRVSPLLGLPSSASERVATRLEFEASAIELKAGAAGVGAGSPTTRYPSDSSRKKSASAPGAVECGSAILVYLRSGSSCAVYTGTSVKCINITREWIVNFLLALAGCSFSWRRLIGHHFDTFLTECLAPSFYCA
jgi:hypothetical protein